MASEGGDGWTVGDVVPWETTDDNAFLVKHTTLRAVVGVFCSLSVIGSLLIILSYVVFKNRRSRAREILLHISLMDLGVALTNLIGLTVYYDRWYYRMSPPYVGTQNDSTIVIIDRLCRTQAFFAAFFTYSSVLWTISLAGYLYCLILHHGTKIALYFLRFCYVFCYGMPLLVAFWLVARKWLGYSPYGSAGWCSLKDKDPETGESHLLITIFGNDLWIYLTIVLIPILYVSVRIYIAQQLRQSKEIIRKRHFLTALHNVDYKFLLIPVVFVTLRMWSIIVSVVYLYVGLNETQVPPWINISLLYLSGIGDSSQGFANAILFVIFSKNVRNDYVDLLLCRRGQGSRQSNAINSEATTPLEGAVDTPSLKSSWVRTRELSTSSDGGTTPLFYKSEKGERTSKLDYGSLN